MSRQSGTKSKQGKDGNKSAAGSGVGQLHDFIPNRFNLTDWMALTREEDDSAFIGDLVDDIVTNVLDQCEKVHMKKQLMPYTLTKTKNVLLQLVQWYFLTHDDGEQHPEIWQEEKEPEPSVIDSWAQGSVPVVVDIPEPTPPPPQEESAKSKSIKEVKVKRAPSPEVTKELPKTSSMGRKHGNCPKVRVPEKMEHCRRKSDPKFTKTHSSIQTNQKEEDTGAMAMVKSKKSIARHNDGVVYDADGYIVRLDKIDTKKLPSYQVNVSYRVITAEYNSPKKKKEDDFMKNKLNRKASTKPETSRRKKSILLRQLTEKYSTLNMVEGLDDRDKCDCPTGMVVDTDQSDTKLDPYVPMLIEAVEASPGVIVREGGVVKKGEEPLTCNSDRKNNKRRYLTVNVKDTAQLRLLPSKSSGSHLQRHSVLPAISPKQNIEAS